MRTDLASECLKQSECMPEGVVFHRQSLGSGAIELAEIISEEAVKKTGKPRGIYITLEIPPFWDESEDTSDFVEAAAEGLKLLIPSEGTVLVVGLGNRDITPDALGPYTAEQILVTRHMESSHGFTGVTLQKISNRRAHASISCSATFIMMAHSMRLRNSSQPDS